ncbi:ATP-dependent helicase [candidate division BRC1 bacterium HGW-BRC1-1]|jgi:DEAD/DEAH box helicase domain-containing protein|nr:MAG: ATP-dependent helicase [candidate division BRC1 bacterium HGW-BRC1-1]
MSSNLSPQSEADEPARVLLESLLRVPHIRNNVAHVHEIPPREAKYGEFPGDLDPRLIQALQARGYNRPYTHQAAAIQHAMNEKNVVVVTPTASGKTLCFNVPVIQRVLEEPEARALYLFPTKALAQDQYGELHQLTQAADGQIKVYTFDGDTPSSARKAIRSAGSLILTNPDMLHVGILPLHTQWIRLFENLRYIVIDEIHAYRGVFGSHVANVLRRLQRICAFYGSAPTFICASATIANPREISEQLLGADVELVSENGAPSGRKYFMLYNPPVINEELGIRRGVVNETRRLAARTLAAEAQTIVFARSRMRVEVLLNYLRKTMRKLHKNPMRVAGYRGGYLPNERRLIEQGVKSGEILGVVSTNALELGIDIGQLRVAIIAGYPGSISATWQQAGRAGRKAESSLAIMVASSAPLDQYLAANPHFLFGQAPESAVVNPDHVQIYAEHVKCAAFELPFEDGEHFGGFHPLPLLQYLEDQQILRHTGNRWHWSSDVYPSEHVSLRSASSENFVVVNTSDRNQVMAEVDFDSAPMLIHTEAIYMHLGETYYIDKLDWDRRTAYARPQQSDYYTDALSKTDIRVLRVDQTCDAFAASSEDETASEDQPSTKHERLKAGEEYPLTATPTAGLPASKDLPPYGPEEIRRQMQGSGPEENEAGIPLPAATVPMIGQPMLSRNFGEVVVSTLVAKFKKIRFETHENIGYGDVSVPVLETQTEAYWLTLSAETKDRIEVAGGDLGAALNGMATLLAQAAPLHLLCDPSDLRAVPMVRAPHDDLPAVYLCDRYPGGIGLARKFFDIDLQVLAAARDILAGCPCATGCPSCVGPEIELGTNAKRGAMILLESIVRRAG